MLTRGIGVVVARHPSPGPRHRGRSKSRETEIDIHTSKSDIEVDIHRSKSRARSKSRHRHVHHLHDDHSLVVVDRSRLSAGALVHRRAHSAAPLPSRVRAEANEIVDRIDSRGRIGEAWHGATRDWAIVDVPPGTERVRMDGVGGGSAEVNWSRYGGVRRTKFIPERGEDSRALVVASGAPGPRASGDRLSVHVHDRNREIDIVKSSDHRRVTHSPMRPPRGQDMWTEITKDLVSKEAIRRMGYPYEETRWFYYIMEYLRHVSFWGGLWEMIYIWIVLTTMVRRMCSSSSRCRMISGGRGG
jgi:hypothetical protein